MYNGNNKINNIGDGLEEFIKNSFIKNTSNYNQLELKEEIQKVFSYLGNTNSPPDMILRNGDAIEVKKIEALKSAIALNSSPPKHKLHVSDPRLTSNCVDCESLPWTQKDILYAIGVVKSKQLSQLSLIYGDCYSASNQVYKRIEDKIKLGIQDISDTEFAETKELGRVNKVDPLGITYLRIRGMWHIENPIKVYDYLYKPDTSKSFNLLCLMRKEKFLSFSEEQRKMLCSHASFHVKGVKIENPDNKANLIDAVLITTSS